MYVCFVRACVACVCLFACCDCARACAFVCVFVWFCVLALLCLGARACVLLALHVSLWARACWCVCVRLVVWLFEVCFVGTILLRVCDLSACLCVLALRVCDARCMLRVLRSAVRVDNRTHICMRPRC